jgi:hypothetical protein
MRIPAMYRVNLQMNSESVVAIDVGAANTSTKNGGR